MTCREGALLLGNARPPPILKHPSHKAKPELKTIDSVSFDDLELCNDQTGEESIKALTYYLTTMVSHLRDNFTSEVTTGTDTPALNSDHAHTVLTGVITSVPDVLENGEYAPWELLVIENHIDVDNVEVVARELLTNPDKLETVQLHSKTLQRFTGIYPGVVVRVKGPVYKTDLLGTPTSVGVEDICLPSRPPINWPSPNTKDEANPTPARIHFLAGPYTRSGIFTPLAHAVRVAAQRGANALVLYGPFVPEVDAVAMNSLTFDDSLNQFFDALEGALSLPEVSNSNLQRVFVVPSLRDINNFPVLPQPKFAIDDEDEKFKVVSNPCAITIAGITFQCANYPSIDAVSNIMADRWHDRQKLPRAGESVLRDRLLVPLQRFPPREHDLKWLGSLAVMDDLEMEPPHAVVFSSHERDHGLAFISHSNLKDLSDPEGDGALVLSLPTGGRKIENGIYNFEAVEVTIPDTLAAATGGLSGGRCSVTVLHETCPIDLGI